MYLTFDELIKEFQNVTLMPEDEIISFVRRQELSYTEVLIFYKRFVRFPTVEESRALNIFSKNGLYFEGLNIIK